jgi:hypothetical protein
MDVRFHNDEAHRVFCVRFMGIVPGALGLELLRARHQKYPFALNFNQIFDVRSWGGYLADDDFVQHFKWVHAFRRDHGLEIPVLPINVYLSTQQVGSSVVVDQLSHMRGQTVALAYTTQEAWEYCAPGIRMPQTVAKFLNAR